MSSQDPTADYRKYPKGPNFLLIVLLSAAFLVLALVIFVFVVHHDGNKMVPHKPSPTPNSRLTPARPGPLTVTSV